MGCIAVLEFYRKTVWFEATSRNSFLYRESEWCSNDVGVLSVLDTFIAVNAVERTNICSVLLVGMLPKCCAFQYKLHLKSGWKCTVWVRDSDGFLFGPWKTPGNSGKTLETSVRALDYVLIHGISFMNQFLVVFVVDRGRTTAVSVVTGEWFYFIFPVWIFLKFITLYGN